MTGLKHYVAQSIRNIRTVTWWREHALMIAPWVVIILTLLASVILYITNDAFHAEASHALAVVRTGDQAQIRDYLLGYGAWAPAVSVILMVTQAVVVGIPASLVMFANGVAFGTGGGALINIIGRMAGAAVTFGIARMLGKGMVERLVGKITHANRFEEWMRRRGGWAVFATRAVPGMPSDMLSYVAGLTNVSWRTYLVATLLGFLPQSIVFAWFGAEATSWFWVVMMSGSILTGVLAVTTLAVQWARRGMRRRKLATSRPTTRQNVYRSQWPEPRTVPAAQRSQAHVSRH